MLYHLIKKDFILVKKYLPMMIGIPALIPLYVGTRPIGGAALIGFTLSSVYTLFMTVQYIFLKESQSPKALSLLEPPGRHPGLGLLHRPHSGQLRRPGSLRAGFHTDFRQEGSGLGTGSSAFRRMGAIIRIVKKRQSC